MGNTIRRKPITFDIPKSPDYKYLNITNFNGLDMTDNLFAASHNTASDSLNVYVDEFGALTTRPRLEKKIDFGISDFSYINVYELTDGYLIYGYENGDPVLYKYNSNDGLVQITEGTGTVPNPDNPGENRLSVFEQNGLIYLLWRGWFINENLGKYLVIENNVLNIVEGYVPTTSVGKYEKIIKEDSTTTNKSGNPYEPLNILSNKYKESYFWDGESDISDFLGENGVVVKNDYIKSESINNVRGYYKYVPDKKINDKKGCFLVSGVNSQFGFILKKDISNNSISSDPIIDLPDLPTHTTYTINYNRIEVDCNSSGDFIAVVKRDYNDGDQSTNTCCGAVYVYRQGVWNILLADPQTNFKIPTNWRDLPYTPYGYGIRISEDGSLITTYTDKEIICFVYDKTNGTYTTVRQSLSNIDSKYGVKGVDISKNTNNVVAISLFDPSLDNQGSSMETTGFDNLYVLFLENNTIKNKKSLTGDSRRTFDIFSVSPNGDKICYRTGGIINTYDLKNDTLVKNTDISSFYHRNYSFMFFNRDGTKLYCGDTQSGLIGYVVMSNNKMFRMDIPLSGNRFSYIGYEPYADNKIIILSTSHYPPSSSGIVMKSIEIKYDSPEPLLIIEKTITQTHEKYHEWTELRETFKNSFLTTRYQNNTWFECENYVFYTQNNDPTYIPIYNYNILGNKNNKITGFNLAGDDILVCYMDDNMFIVQPTVINNISTYSFSESKNTVGNKAYGSTIVSTLSEIPLQINYDGIYALNQLQNIESSERVATLISNGIQPKWLAESKSSIDNLKTVNRLYWTYFVLTKNNFTKIYLLDNRNMSWYYWELPIKCLNAFTKDDAVEFVDYDGIIYSFKTSDIINKYNPSLTEYYDEGKKIINWYWKSQILPLGTINYSKKLLESTFIIADTDDSDEFGFNYKFKVFRKLANETNTTTITNKLNLIQSTTKRTLVPRFNFIQLELSNVEDDLNNNKMRLLGIGLKYTLLEALR